MGRAQSVLSRARRLPAATVDARLRVVMIAATLLVIPDLVLEERPLRGVWHTAAVVGDWVIWLVFLLELVAVMVFARDRRAWLRRYPLAPAMLLLTPPFAPAALQALRVFRLLRLLRVARGVQMLRDLLTLDGLRYLLAVAAFLVVGGGVVFASVESHAGHRLSTWDGIWWATGTLTTEGSTIQASTGAGRAIAVVLMLTGIGVFSVMTGAVAQHFLRPGSAAAAVELTDGERAIIERLDDLAGRMERIEASRSADGRP